MRLNVYGSQPHYLDHIRPIFRALEPDWQGLVFKPTSLPRAYNRSNAPVTIVASGVDAQTLRGCDLIYVEHGAGQSYGGDERSARSQSYSGGDGLEHVSMFVCPNEAVARRWSKRYPDAETVVVGCPRLDELDICGVRKPWPAEPVLGWSFHWNCRLVPETMSARPHWSPSMPMLTSLAADLGFAQVMTSHPKAAREGEIMAHRLGLQYTADASKFLAEIDLLVCDNSSLMYEAAALGRRVIALNAPWYRRDVHHGLRFWDRIPGPDVDDAGQLADMLARVSARDTIMLEMGRLAKRATDAAYAYVDGSSGRRAADAIMERYDD